MSQHDASSQKSALRAATLAKRDAMPAAERQTAADTLAARGLPVAIEPGLIVSGFMPMNTEINPLALLRTLKARGPSTARARGAMAPHVRGRVALVELRASPFVVKAVSPDLLVSELL